MLSASLLLLVGIFHYMVSGMAPPGAVGAAGPNALGGGGGGIPSNHGAHTNKSPNFLTNTIAPTNAVTLPAADTMGATLGSVNQA